MHIVRLVKPFEYGKSRIQRLKSFIRVHEQNGIAAALEFIINQPKIFRIKKTARSYTIVGDAHQAQLDFLFNAKFQVIKIYFAVQRPR